MRLKMALSHFDKNETYFQVSFFVLTQSENGVVKIKILSRQKCDIEPPWSLAEPAHNEIMSSRLSIS